METLYRSSRTSLQALKALRITQWGVQGSCPIFPMPKEVHEYSRRIAVFALARAIEDMAKKAKSGKCSVEDLLGGPPTAENIEKYQQELGLPDVPVYGGETTCIEVETIDGNVLIFDGGSGIRHCALSICKRYERRKDRKIYIFGSHEHLDHRSGLPFARFCFVKDNPFHIQVYGTREFLMALDVRFGLFSKTVSPTAHLDDPLDYRFMAAKFTATEIARGDPADGSGLHRPTPDRPPPWDHVPVEAPIRIGNTAITPFDVFHGDNRCLAYKVQHGGASFIFCTDHELRRGTDPNDPRQKRSEIAEARLRKYCQNADVAYVDGQYLLEEYKGLKGIGSSLPSNRMDWGHSCIEDVIERAKACRIKHTFIGHFDPERDWPDRIELDQKLAELCKGQNYKIELAKGSALIEI